MSAGPTRRVPPTLTGQPLHLALTATSDPSSAHTGGGTGTLGTDPPTVTGTVTGGSASRHLRPQTSSIPADPWPCRPSADGAGRFTLLRGTP